MSSPQRLREVWQRDETAYGIFCTLPSALSARMVASVGWDYVGLDLQHGGITEADAVGMFQALSAGGAVPIARVPATRSSDIQRILDLGAQGIVAPMIETRAQAEELVAACSYPPAGVRSFGPIAAQFSLGTTEPRELEQVLKFAMIETEAALRNLDDIASVPGLDGLYVGPTDLALALGLAPEYEPSAEEHRRATDRIVTACLGNKLVPAVHCNGFDCAKRRGGQGFKMITIANEIQHMLRSVREAHTAVRAMSGGS